MKLWSRSFLAFSCIAFCSAAASAQIASDAGYQTRYAANLNIGESYITITNTGANGAPLLGPGLFGTNTATGNICVNIYTIDPNEELISCCSCLVTPDQTVNLRVSLDLTSQTLTGTASIPTSVTVALVATLAGTGGSGSSCQNSAGIGGAVVNGMAAWGTTLHLTSTAGTYATTATSFTNVSGSAGGAGSNLASLVGRCASIIGNAGGHGICTSCLAGASEIALTINTSQLPAATFVGESIADQATVSGGFNPTGTVMFNLYNNPNGTGMPLFTDTETLSGGMATSKGYITTVAGTDYWVATYNGDSNNSAVTSGTALEPVAVDPASPTISTFYEPPGSSFIGGSNTDIAFVSGGNNPTGTVTFNLYNNPNGTGKPLFTDTEALSSGIATSKGYTTTATGTNYWVATYNGDSNNSAVTSGTALEPMTVSKASPTITTFYEPPGPSFVGGSNADIAFVGGGNNPTGTVTFNLYNNPNGTGMPLSTDSDEPLVSGTATSKGYTFTATGTYYWVATYNGDSDNNSAVTSVSFLIAQPPPPLTLMFPGGPAANGHLGAPYSATLAATGGVPPYEFSISVGTLPAGLTLNASTGAITGTPTKATSNPAPTLTAKVLDSTGAYVTATGAINITAPPPLNLPFPAGSAANGTVGIPYSLTLSATGGVPPYTYSVSLGVLPKGLTLNASTGAITGTPTTTVNGPAANITFKVVDSATPTHASATASGAINITGATPGPAPPPPPP